MAGMATPDAYPLSSSWQPHHHDMNDSVPGPAMTVGDRSFEINQSRPRRGSSPGKRALQWFTRSRSTSPNNAEPSSPSSFVVRNVVRQPGGVSHDQGNAASEYYQRLKSQPLATSLGVPPGGPGGGIGYGTAKSSNDGRPEEPMIRGRSRSPARPSSPGAMTAGAFRSGRVSPGPQSWAQAKEADEQRKRDYSRDRGIPRKPVESSSPDEPRRSPLSGAEGQIRGTPLQPSSPLVGAGPMSTTLGKERHSFSMPVRFSPNSGPPPIIPLEGVPSPIDIPSLPAQAGTTPIGSVSPAGSPGRFMSSSQARDSPGSPNVASRWMKGLFGKMPRTEEPTEDHHSEEVATSQWMQGTSPSAHASASKYLHNSWSDGSPLPSSRSRDEIEAEARKRESMHMAMRIEDQHRDQVIRMSPSPALANKNWRPRQSMGIDGEEDDAMPRSRSPPGRKPVPRFSVEELQGMTEREREDVATLVDPSGQLSKMEGRLTPAQQIIAETRSRQIEKERAEKQTQVQRGFSTHNQGGPERTSPQRPSREDAKTPIRRNSGQLQSPTKVNDMTPQANRSAFRPSPQASPDTAAISAGNGPMPLEMPLADAVQEMMVRFYRFEKYAVPLMRSMEARIVDVERDNQMALHGDAMSANSVRDRDMDKWVGQMTYLMKHEIGQLKAATREIRVGRELLEQYAKDQKELLNIARRREECAEHNRNSNFSSSTFNSAVPRKLTLEVPASDTEAVESQTSPSGRPRYTSALGQPMRGGRLSPATSPVKDTATMSRSSSQQRATKLNERLKALVVEKIRSSSGTSASVSDKSISAQEEGDESSENTSFEKVSSDERITDNYQVVMARGASEASARSASDDDFKNRETASIMTSTTAKKPIPHDTVKANGIAFPTSYIRPRSVSPVAVSGNTASITLPSHATNGLRARAQSYLLNAESSNGNSSVPTSPIPSPNWRNTSPILQQVQPLRYNKSNKEAATIKPRSNSELLGVAVPTLKSSDSPGGSTPIRASIRDRVAFFDAPK